MQRKILIVAGILGLLAAFAGSALFWIFLLSAVGEVPIPTLVPSPPPCVARDTSPPVIIKTLSGHALSATGVTFSADGDFIASWSYDGTVRLWETNSGKLLKVIGMEYGDPNEVYLHEVIDARFSRDGRQVYSVSADRKFQVYEIASDTVVSSSQGNWNLGGARISPDGLQIAVAQSASIWSVTGPKLLHQFQAPNQIADRVAYSPNGTLLAMLVRDTAKDAFQSIIIIDSTLGSEIRRLSELSSGLASLTFSRDGRFLAAAGDKAEIWDTSTWQNVSKFDQVKVSSLDLSPDDSILAVGNFNNVELLDTHEQCTITHLGPPAVGVNAVSFSPDGRFLALAAGKEVQVWQLR